MKPLWGCHLSPASRTPLVQSQRLDISCQTHRKTEFRLCQPESRPRRHSLSPSLITELSLDSSIPDFAYSPHIRVNALPSSTGALSTCSNSSDMIKVLGYKTMSNTNSPGNSDLLFWQLKNGGSVMKWMAELRVRGKSQPMTTRTRCTWHLRCSLVCKTRRQVALIGRIFSYFCPECMAA